MEFWGVEVKAGQKLKVQPEFGQLIHISQASLGEVKDVKGAKHVPLRVKIDDKNFIIGSLSAENIPQVMFDLVFEREFELSHDWKNGSIYFLGYIADDPVSDEELSSGDDQSEDELLLEAPENGVVAKAEAGAVKPVEKAAAAKAAAKDKAKKEEEQDSDEDDDDDDDESESGSDDEMNLDGVPEIDSDDSEDDSEDEDESEEETPKVQQSKKRPAGSAEKTPLPKKAKSATPDKSGKKGQNATPAPPKSAGKTPNKGKEQTPKSGGQLSCKSCSKTFNSDAAMQSHNKAKHGGK